MTLEPHLKVTLPGVRAESLLNVETHLQVLNLAFQLGDMSLSWISAQINESIQEVFCRGYAFQQVFIGRSLHEAMPVAIPTQDIERGKRLIPTCTLRGHSKMGKIGHGVKKLRIVLKSLQLVTKGINHGIKGGKDTVRKSFFP